MKGFELNSPLMYQGDSIADAILDRITLKACTIRISGDKALRKK